MMLFKNSLCNVTLQVVLFEKKDSGHLGKKELETILRGYIAIYEIFARKRLELRLSQISLSTRPVAKPARQLVMQMEIFLCL